jgi:hypothetical protein
VAFPVTKLREMISPSPAGFYASRQRPPSVRSMSEAELVVVTKRVFEENRRRYGSPRIRRELRGLGYEVGRSRHRRLRPNARESDAPDRGDRRLHRQFI